MFSRLGVAVLSLLFCGTNLSCGQGARPSSLAAVAGGAAVQSYAQYAQIPVATRTALVGVVGGLTFSELAQAVQPSATSPAASFAALDRRYRNVQAYAAALKAQPVQLSVAAFTKAVSATDKTTLRGTSLGAEVFINMSVMALLDRLAAEKKVQPGLGLVDCSLPQALRTAISDWVHQRQDGTTTYDYPEGTQSFTQGAPGMTFYQQTAGGANRVVITGTAAAPTLNRAQSWTGGFPPDGLSDCQAESVINYIGLQYRLGVAGPDLFGAAGDYLDGEASS